MVVSSLSEIFSAVEASRRMGPVTNSCRCEEAKTPIRMDIPKTIKAVTEDIEKLSFNTAISRMMEFTNALSPQDVRPKAVLEPFVLLLSPFAPHLAEELWSLLGHDDTLAYVDWPQFDESLIAESTVEIPVQFNGKVRARIKVPAEASKDDIESAAMSDESVQKNLDGKTVVKTIVIPGRMVNIVVKG